MIFTERISDERLVALTTSPKLLREFISEQEKNQSLGNIHSSNKKKIRKTVSPANSSTWKNKFRNRERGKCRATAELHYTADSKRPKYFDDLNSTDDDSSIKIISSSYFVRNGKSNSISDDTISNRTWTASPVPSTSSNMMTREPYYSDDESNCSAPMISALNDLFALYKLCLEKENDSKTNLNKKVNIYKKEYVVKKIVKINECRTKPYFLVNWQGYSSDRDTWEPLSHVEDCKPFLDFITNEMKTYKSETEELWTEMAMNKNDSSQEHLSDTDALKQISKFQFFQFKSDLILLAIFKYNKRRVKSKTYDTIYSRVLADIRLLPYYKKRLDQLQHIFEWKRKINLIDNSSKLRVENNVDFEVPPIDFTYTNDVVPGDGVTIPDEPPIGCECNTIDGGCGKRSNCCGKISGSQFAYNRNRSICVLQGTGIFECNKRCKCGPECINRVVQQGRKHSLCIFKTGNGCGWGVRTNLSISQGQFICEYVGEIITYEETEKRGKIYDAQGRTYLFDLDFNDSDNLYSIDAAKCGNVSHFINHSCDPNLGVWAVWSNCLDLDLPKICLFALRHIEAGEEITFDYTNQNNNRDRDQNTANEQNEKNMSPVDKIPQKLAPELESTECKCGADNCRKVLF